MDVIITTVRYMGGGIIFVSKINSQQKPDKEHANGYDTKRKRTGFDHWLKKTIDYPDLKKI